MLPVPARLSAASPEPRAQRCRGAQLLPAPLGVYFGQTACQGVMLRLNLDTKNDYFLEQLLGNPQPSTWLRTLLSGSYSRAATAPRLD